MKKLLVNNGNGWYLYISVPILKILGFEPKDTKLLLTIQDKILKIEKINPEDEARYQGKMVKKLSRKGGGWGLSLPNPILELLEINPEKDLVEYNVNLSVLTIKRAD